MRAVLAIASETSKLLRRDRIFIPAFMLVVFIFAFGAAASDWGIEEFRKILYDIGTAGFHFTGVLVALYWGTKIVSDTKRDGSIELQLAAPISRGTWLLGKYLGLVSALLWLAVILLICWQALCYFTDFGLLNRADLLIFGFHALEWLVIAASAILLGAISSQGTAMFAGLALWLAGMFSAPILQAIPPKTPEWSRAVLQFLARFWNFERFNLSEFVVAHESLPGQTELFFRFGYGLGIIMVLLGIAILAFSKRDLSG